MRREGRQHGMVRTCVILPSPLNPRPNSRVVNRFESQTTAGLFTKVQTKPTGHSKFTGKCGKARCEECHSHPVCKSKSKAKGAQKLKSCDVAKNHLLVAWRVVDYEDEDDVVEEEYDDEDEDGYSAHQASGIQKDHVRFGLEQVVEEDKDWCIIENYGDENRNSFIQNCVIG